MFEWLDKLPEILDRVASIIEAGGKSIFALIALAIAMVFVALLVLFRGAKSEYIKLASLILLIVFATFSIAVASKLNFHAVVEGGDGGLIVTDTSECDRSVLNFSELVKCES